MARRMKARYDQNRSSLDLQPEDLVLLSTKSHRSFDRNRKQSQRYVGPYVIQSKVNDNAYRLSGLPDGVPTTQNVKFLMLFKPSPHRFIARPTPPTNIPEVIDGYHEWEVESILRDRSTRRNHRFLVKWAHSPQKQWLPLRSLVRCRDLLREYYEKDCRPIPDTVEVFLNESSEADLSDKSHLESESETSQSSDMDQD